MNINLYPRNFTRLRCGNFSEYPDGENELSMRILIIKWHKIYDVYLFSLDKILCTVKLIILFTSQQRIHILLFCFQSTHDQPYNLYLTQDTLSLVCCCFFLLILFYIIWYFESSYRQFSAKRFIWISWWDFIYEKY